MEGVMIDYQSSFDYFFEQIKIIRDPHSGRHERTDQILEEVKREQLFDFGNSSFERCSSVITQARTFALGTMKSLVQALFLAYNVPVETLEDDLHEVESLKNISFGFADKSNKRLLLFKDVENDLFWKPDKEPDDIQSVMRKYDAASCVYVYLVYDKAELLVMSRNPENSAVFSTSNVVSLLWLFETYFTKSEFDHFKEAALSFTQRVKEYIGFIQVKTLTPKTLISFKRYVDHNLRTFDYKSYLSNYRGTQVLSDEEYEFVAEKFIDQKAYTILLGNAVYAESFITAEWLFCSMKAAKAVDLTIIAMGYFKAIEQLYYAVICLHKGEGRHIRCGKKCRFCQRAQDMRCYSQNHTLPVSELSINEEFIDSTIGSMEYFFRDNKSLMLDIFPHDTRERIATVLSDAHKLRNAYMHKQNIHDWSIIEDARALAYALVFLLLGAYKYSDEDRQILGLPDSKPYTDYYRLCEYFNYHCNNLFRFSFDDDKRSMHVIAQPDLHTKIAEEGFIQYSGVYFTILSDQSRQRYCITEHDVPQCIYSAKVDFGWEGEIKLDLKDVTLIYENGIFCGPSIADEDSLEF